MGDLCLHTLDAVADEENREDIAVVLVETRQPFYRGKVRHVELRVGPVRLDIDDVVQTVAILKREVSHCPAGEVRGVLATVLAKNVLEGCRDHVLDGIPRS